MSSPDRPLLSVIMPTHNRAEFIRESIESALGQTWAPLELIVVDNGSTDGTSEILAQFGDRIRVLHRDNRGPSPARNLGLSVARGKYVGFLDSDDLWEPDMAARAIAHLEQHPKQPLVAGGWTLIDPRGRFLNRGTAPAELRPILRERFLWRLLLCNAFPIHAVIVRRDAIERAGGFDDDLPGGEDWDLWIRIAALGESADALEGVFAHYRRHPGGATRNLAMMEASLARLRAKTFANPLVKARFPDGEPHMEFEQLIHLHSYALEARDAAAIKDFVARLHACAARASTSDVDRIVFHLDRARWIDGAAPLLDLWGKYCGRGARARFSLAQARLALGRREPVSMVRWLARGLLADPVELLRDAVHLARTS